jgi:hypothetical protein
MFLEFGIHVRGATSSEVSDMDSLVLNVVGVTSG